MSASPTNRADRRQVERAWSRHHDSTIVGYRVKTTDDWHVHLVEFRYAAFPEPHPLLTKPEALRRMAAWIERGYIPRLFAVRRRPREEQKEQKGQKKQGEPTP